MKHYYNNHNNDNFGWLEVFTFLAKTRIVLMVIVLIAIGILEVILH